MLDMISSKLFIAGLATMVANQMIIIMVWWFTQNLSTSFEWAMWTMLMVSSLIYLYNEGTKVEAIVFNLARFNIVFDFVMLFVLSAYGQL